MRCFERAMRRRKSFVRLSELDAAQSFDLGFLSRDIHLAHRLDSVHLPTHFCGLPLAPYALRLFQMVESEIKLARVFVCLRQPLVDTRLRYRRIAVAREHERERLGLRSN